MNTRSTLRHWLRTIGQTFPQLRHFGGQLGLGRWVAPDNIREQITVDGDVVIELDLSVPIFRYIYFHHDLTSAPETILIRRLVTPSDTFVDVGAHIGYVALVAAKYAAHVFAFEPSPSTYEYLQRNIQLNPNLQSRITSLAVALSDEPGRLQLHRPLSHPGAASLQMLGASDVVVEQVQVETLDHLLANNSVAFIKIDVEGAEFNVLLGATKTIEQNHPLVLCELFEPFQNRFGHSCQDIANFFRMHGYDSYRMESPDRSKVIIEPLDLSKLSTIEANNAIFVPTEQTAQVVAKLSN